MRSSGSAAVPGAAGGGRHKQFSTSIKHFSWDALTHVYEDFPKSASPDFEDYRPTVILEIRKRELLVPSRVSHHRRCLARSNPPYCSARLLRPDIPAHTGSLSN